MTGTNADDCYRGVGGAPGHRTGRAHVMHTMRDAMDIPLGSILVMRIMHPHLAPLFSRVGGVVVEEGALLQHATTLAREFRVPAVVGLRDATRIFSTGDVLEVNGNTGQVSRKGPSTQ